MPQVLLIGGGPVGLTLAALLARQGISCCVVEADASYCTGSRAICISRRSQEIFGWIGTDQTLANAGLPWSSGRSYYRNTEVLRFDMPSEATQRFAPMLNIQQYTVEEIAHHALLQAALPVGSHAGAAVEVLWSTRLISLVQTESGVSAEVESADGQRQTLNADYLVACDGGRSTVRELMGLQLKGTQYEGRYVIVDIEQKSARPTERLAWFDPPSNPGSTLLMHRQPHDVWRVDYQLADDEDPEEAVKPAHVLPRVARHLEMIGEHAPWKPLWISIYNAKCLTLDSYRHGRVMFAGDAAHLVPIFGVRGLNSGLDDAANLAWKLAAVLRGANASLLDSYSQERRDAALQNMAYGAKSTEFMSPPNFAFRLMREAALRLAQGDPRVRSLINPRQSLPVAYSSSSLNVPDSEPWVGGASPGTPAPEVLLLRDGQPWHLSRAYGAGFVLLYFASAADAHSGLDDWPSTFMRVIRITPELDLHGQAHERFAAKPGTCVAIRPDGYVLGRWRRPDRTAIAIALQAFRA
jgi:3-(3-hydroxy-phenyl)propionate hydroxylase